MLLTLDRHGNQVDDIVFSPDGSRLASASHDNTIRLWDAETAEELRTIKGHSNYVTSVSFSPDGQFLASASWDRTIKLWRGTTGCEVRTLDGHAATISNIIFDRSGSRILSTDADGTAIAWDVVSGRKIPKPDQWPVDPGEQAGYSPDGRWLALAFGSQIQVVDLDYKTTPLERAYRQSKGEFDPDWHLEWAVTAETAQRWFEALFHRTQLVKHDPNSNEAHFRMRLLADRIREADPRLLANLPSAIEETLKAPAPPLTESYADRFNMIVLSHVAVPDSDPISAVSMLEMKAICEKYPLGRFFHTLGIAQYRAGDYDAAIDSLTNSLVMMPKEFNLVGPHPGDLAFFAMCLYQLDQREVANDFRRELAAGVHNDSFRADKLDVQARLFLAEVNELFE